MDLNKLNTIPERVDDGPFFQNNRDRHGTTYEVTCKTTARSYEHQKMASQKEVASVMSASQFQFYLTTRGWIVKAMLATGAMVIALSNLAITRNLSQVKLFIMCKDPCPFGRQGSG